MCKSNNHPSFEQLADYIDGRLSMVDAHEVEALVAGCAACAEEIAWLQETMATIAEQWEMPSEPVRARVHRAFRDSVPVVARKETAVSWWQDLFRSIQRPQRQWQWATAVGLFIIMMAGLAWHNWQQQTIVQVVTVNNIEGVVMVKMSEDADWQPLSREMELQKGAVIQTGADASVILHFSGNSATLLSAHTRLQILESSVQRNNRKMLIHLYQEGGYSSTQARLLHPENAFLLIETPVSHVRVSGSSYRVDLPDGGIPRVSVVRGCAEIKTNGWLLVHNPGQKNQDACFPGQEAPDQEIEQVAYH